MHRVAIVGGAGRMGQAMARGLGALEDLSVVALVDVNDPEYAGGALVARVIDDLDPATLDVVVDFSAPAGVVRSANWCATHGKGLVIGTTGMGDAEMAAVREAATRTGVVMAANFSLGAVLAERFAQMAAPFFPSVEIIELHHDRKVDAPSGTSIATARAIASARRGPVADPTEKLTLDGARGADVVDGVRVHSVRLPGLTAHQEVLFGGPGEGLSIRHDSYDRTSFVPGVALAVRAVSGEPGLRVGIDSLLGGA